MHMVGIIVRVMITEDDELLSIKAGENVILANAKPITLKTSVIKYKEQLYSARVV